MSRQFSNSYLAEFPGLLSFYEIRELLWYYITPNEFIHEIWIDDGNNQTFFSSTQMLNQDSSMRFGPYYPGTGSYLQEIINSANANTWIPESPVRIFENDNNLLTYIIVFPFSRTHYNTRVAILINGEIFYRTIGAIIPYERSAMAVIDGNGQIIYSHNNSINSAAEIIFAGETLNEGPSTIKTAEGDFFVYVMNSPQNQLSYVSIFPYRELTREVRQHTLVFSWILLGILLCGSFLIFLLMQFNYIPLRDIVRSYNAYSQAYSQYRKSGNNEEYPITNEIELIRKTLENISEENRSLSMMNEKYMREEMLFNLLKGKTTRSETLLNAGIDPASGKYMALIFQLENNKYLQFADFEKTIKKTLPSFIQIFLLESLENNSFIGIMSWKEDAIRIRDTLESLCMGVLSEHRNEIRIACGSRVGHIEGLSRSYSEAKIALRYQVKNEAQKIIEFQDMNMNIIPDNIYISAEMNTLEESVRSKNSRRTAFIISELIETIKNANTSYFYAVCLCYSIINIFIQEIHKIKNNAAREIIKKHQMLFLDNFDHPIENLITIVHSLSVETMRVLDNDQAHSRIVSKDNILKFIVENHRAGGFCIQTVQDHFGISLSNLSHQFKSYTGENISSYINALKMSYAKELLSSSDMTINEIAEKLGYFQTSSFIKRFKSIEGMTPREYRGKTAS